MKIAGELEVDSIRLESILTDLYVSLMVQLIELTQLQNPSYEYGSKVSQPSQTSQSQKSSTAADMINMKLRWFSRKVVIHLDALLVEFFSRKASLALMESDNTKQNTHIVNCTLHESTAKLTR